VDLDDIENSILKYDDISIVSVLHNLMGQGEIIAFYSTSSGEKIDTRNLIQFLKREVILEGIPRHFEHLNSIPMNAHGKIDRNSLAHNFKTKISKVIEGNELKAIWKQYLPTAEILPETHFFEDGGDSLSALNLINEVEELMGLNLEVNFLSKFPKFDRFCEMIYKHRSNLKLLNSSKTDY
jgi:acyl carrier protein